MDKFEKFISVLESSLETYRSSDPSIALQKAIDATKDEDGAQPPQHKIDLFVGARCVRRDGSKVTVVANDGVSCNNDMTTYPFMSTCKTKTYRADGAYIDGCARVDADIIRILNPQDRPSPVKYRQVNQFDVDKECEYWNEDSCSWKPCVLKAIYKTPAPDGSRFSIYDHSSREEWSLEPEDVQIVARDNDPVVKTMYLNVYANGAGFPYPDADSADRVKSTGRSGRIKVEYINGQYDE